MTDQGIYKKIMPYSRIVGQDQLKLALELAWIDRKINGVLLSGHRGTGKSTAVRAFWLMMEGKLPVTLPINATEDRVVGGLDLEALMRHEADDSGKPKRKQGLMEQAHEGALYIDEVNLLDDHIVNIILDVASTGVLVIQRETQDENIPVSFTLLGTMNPEEGGLRPQLQDRFDLMVEIRGDQEIPERVAILENLMHFEAGDEDFLKIAQKEDAAIKQRLRDARTNLDKVVVGREIHERCARLAVAFELEGTRGDAAMSHAAKAYAAREGETQTTMNHLKTVGPLAITHRRKNYTQPWSEADQAKLEELIP